MKVTIDSKIYDEGLWAIEYIAEDATGTRRAQARITAPAEADDDVLIASVQALFAAPG